MTLKQVLAFILIPFPSLIKIAVMRRVLGYTVGSGVRIGFSVVNAGACRIGDNVRIGHFNFISHMHQLDIGDDAIIGHCNILVGGTRVELGDGAMIGRFNEINSIINPLVRGTPDPRLTLGRRAVVTASHKIDFTDSVTLEDSVVLAGRLSNLWTHNRQDIAPVTIGSHCYIGSGIQMAPGSRVGPHCVVGMGSVITSGFEQDHVLIAGVPAKVIKPLDANGLRLVTFPTRPDLDGMADLEIGTTAKEFP